MSAGIPIILLSGMAADERLFQAQVEAIPNLRIQPWIPAIPGESVGDYAARLVPLMDSGEPCLVGGTSFGGAVALEVAARMPALGCILIGSFRSPAGLPWRLRLLRPVAALGPTLLGRLAGCTAEIGRPFLAPRTVRGLRRLSDPESAFVRWAMCAVARWWPSPAAQRVRVFQIHGAADHVLPVALARADVVVPGGSHALSLFNPSAVTAFIFNVAETVAPAKQPLKEAVVAPSASSIGNQ